MASSRCIFPSCCEKGSLQVFKVAAIKKIIQSSKDRGDDIHQKLEMLLETGDSATIECHKNCYCSYTSKQNIAKYLAKKRRDGFPSSVNEEPRTRVRRSQLPTFQFQKHCLICVEECVAIDPRHPERWNRVIQCETKDRPGYQAFKDVLLDACEQRNDEWGRQVEIRIKGALTDLPAADAQYHKKCYDLFMIMPKHTNLLRQCRVNDDDALEMVINHLYDNQKLCTWTSIELYDMYCSFGGELSCKQMFSKLVTTLGDDIVVVHLEGCASVVGFRDLVGKSLKLVKVDSVNEERVDAVVRQVRCEAESVEYNNAVFDLGDFTYNNTLKQTSATLLNMISELVSNGKITQKSLSLAQAIQSHITGTRNQTTLGLAAKLHHRYGSSELIKLLHDYGFTVSYDEVIRFRKSAAKFVGDNTTLLHQAMGVTRRVGPIFGWFDNFDLQVSTPNGCRETHVMAHEFQMNPAGIIEKGSAELGVMNLVIPRLPRSVAQVHQAQSISLVHYTGPKKVNPPLILVSSGIPYTDVCARNRSLASAEVRDAQWLNTLSSDQSIEWHGFNNQLARELGSPALKPQTVYLLGHLIDAPPSHPDTVLTSLLYMKKVLSEQGMACANISVDMQLYMLAQNNKVVGTRKVQRCHHLPRCNAHYYVILGMYWNTDERVRSGCLGWCSIWTSFKYHEWKGMGNGYESISHGISSPAS
uniref:uncharacterized protein n=1 Tax=Myxine glutinosa TaxID=7769 RepID=UPI00358E0907